MNGSHNIIYIYILYIFILFLFLFHHVITTQATSSNKDEGKFAHHIAHRDQQNTTYDQSNNTTHKEEEMTEI